MASGVLSDGDCIGLWTEKYVLSGYCYVPVAQSYDLQREKEITLVLNKRNSEVKILFPVSKYYFLSLRDRWMRLGQYARCH